MKRLAILGSTGSIGKQTLEVVAQSRDKLAVSVLAVHHNIDLLEEQIERFTPKAAVVFDVAQGKILKERYQGTCEIFYGQEALMSAVVRDDVDIVLTALVGFAGLRPTVTAIEHGKTIALANKETLVAAGEIIMPLAEKNNVKILPVDSEHSAIFQCLNGEQDKNVARIILTASGGPFRGKDLDFLGKVSLEDCLKHPNWSMGKKITVDSASLANKGLEVIEAHWLYGVGYDKIDVVVHPQSIVHSMVEFSDGAVIAQLGLPDMRLPIQYALSYPERWAVNFGSLDFFKHSNLTFEVADKKVFRALDLAYQAGFAGGVMPCIFNAANEVAVNAFLNRRISFLQISDLIELALNKVAPQGKMCLDFIEETDFRVRQYVEEEIMKLIEGS